MLYRSIISHSFSLISRGNFHLILPLGIISCSVEIPTCTLFSTLDADADNFFGSFYSGAKPGGGC
jgi:hypothetical protein